jgi:hypothetical protein
MPLLTELEIWLGLVSTKMSRLRRWAAALLEPASWCCYASKRFMLWTLAENFWETTVNGFSKAFSPHSNTKPSRKRHKI